MSFTDALDNWRAPSADDLEIVVPLRREPKKEPDAEGAEVRDLGEHGGGADGTPASSEGRGDAGASAAEPEPQRDDPDDGEHTDSTEEQLAARARRLAELEPEGDAEPADEEEVRSAAQDAVVDAEAERQPVEGPKAPELELVDRVRKPEVAKRSGRQAFKRRLGFSTGAGVETLTVTRFPQPFVDRLRQMLAPVIGNEFAQAISAPALLTSFLMATLGVDLDVDENTAAAAEAFRTSEPRISAVEDKIDGVLENIDQLAGAMRLSLTRISETANVADAMEFGLAYLVADRVVGLSTLDTDETNVDVAQKKVLAARQRIRARTKEQRTIEKQQDGRRMA
jgi:hypothetical protein